MTRGWMGDSNNGGADPDDSDRRESPGVVIKVSPIGTRRAGGFQHHTDGSVTTEWDEPVYQPHPQGKALRDERVAAKMGLRAASTLLGLSPEIVSGLEHGRYTFVDADDWDIALDAIARFDP